MKLFSQFALLLGLAAVPAFCQVNRFSATTGDVSLSGAGTTLTIQQPATNGKLVSLEGATVYCSVACNVTQYQNGTAATTTAGTVTPILPQGAANFANIFTASNVGTGTLVGGIVRIAGGPGTDRSFALAPIVLPPGNGAGINYSIVISSITGTANITLTWNER